jgi:hypothetical protein
VNPLAYSTVSSATDESQQDSNAPQQSNVEHRATDSIPENEALDRPDWWPENFWKDGDPDLEGIAKSWMDMRKMVSQGKHKPPADGNYDTAAFGEGDIESMPLAPAVLNWAKEWGVSQAAFDALVSQVRGAAADFGPSEPAIDVAAEMKSLGPNGEAIKNGMVNWARGLVNKGVWDANDFDEFRVMGGTARGLRALMKIRESYEGRIPVESQPMDGMPTDQELQQMVGTKEYYDNPAYRAKVEKLFQQRYG